MDDNEQFNDEQFNMMNDMVADALGMELSYNNDVEDEQGEQPPNEQAQRFYELLNECNVPLFEGCTQSKLSMCVRLLAHKCKCSWDAIYQDIMRRNFHIRVSARFSDLLRRARFRFEETGKRPHWIGPPIFADLVKYWASDEFKKISQKAKMNRASEKGGCIHTGGCLSNGEHADRLTTRLRRDPFINEIHDKTHKNKSGQYCDDRARRVQEEYDRLLAEAISKGATVDHSLTFRTWKKVVGDKKKGKLYGLGNLAANYRDLPGSQLTPEMRELIHRLAQEQFAQQMATQAAVVQDLLNRQRSYEEQLAQFRQAQAQDPSPVLSPNVEPYPVDRDEEEDGVDDDDD
ncbi:uncharacterized protein [Medicago truncatula]|uniref:uncharacterized protein n=1 Tax=Medicago truncatula TaxID=3880 RepID=UPI000D2F2805|nr:uncharacterized protein LOC112421945 [Medicago truncatula]